MGVISATVPFLIEAASEFQVIPLLRSLSYFPLPWATDPADSFLVSAAETSAVLGEVGFFAEVLEDTSDAHLSRTAADSAPSPLALGLYVDNLVQKAGNARRSLEERQVRLIRGVFRVK